MICRAICNTISHVNHRQSHDQLIKTSSWLIKTSITCRALVNVLFLKFSALQLSLHSFPPPPPAPHTHTHTHKALPSLFFPTNFVKDGLITVVSWFIYMLEVRICFDLSAAILLSTYAWVSTLRPSSLWRTDTILWLLENSIWCQILVNKLSPPFPLSPLSKVFEINKPLGGLIEDLRYPRNKKIYSTNTRILRTYFRWNL